MLWLRAIFLLTCLASLWPGPPEQPRASEHGAAFVLVVGQMADRVVFVVCVVSIQSFDAETGLVYLRNRYYEPDLGCFTQVDPARAGNDWFGYAGGDPVNRWDPSGLIDIEVEIFGKKVIVHIPDELIPVRYRDAWSVPAGAGKDQRMLEWKTYYDRVLELDIEDEMMGHFRDLNPGAYDVEKHAQVKADKLAAISLFAMRLANARLDRAKGLAWERNIDSWMEKPDGAALLLAAAAGNVHQGKIWEDVKRAEASAMDWQRALLFLENKRQRRRDLLNRKDIVSWEKEVKRLVEENPYILMWKKTPGDPKSKDYKIEPVWQDMKKTGNQLFSRITDYDRHVKSCHKNYGAALVKLMGFLNPGNEYSVSKYDASDPTQIYLLNKNIPWELPVKDKDGVAKNETRRMMGQTPIMAPGDPVILWQPWIAGKEALAGIETPLSVARLREPTIELLESEDLKRYWMNRHSLDADD